MRTRATMASRVMMETACRTCSICATSSSTNINSNNIAVDTPPNRNDSFLQWNVQFSFVECVCVCVCSGWIVFWKQNTSQQQLPLAMKKIPCTWRPVDKLDSIEPAARDPIHWSDACKASHIATNTESLKHPDPASPTANKNYNCTVNHIQWRFFYYLRFLYQNALTSP